MEVTIQYRAESGRECTGMYSRGQNQKRSALNFARGRLLLDTHSFD